MRKLFWLFFGSIPRAAHSWDLVKGDNERDEVGTNSVTTMFFYTRRKFFATFLLSATSLFISHYRHFCNCTVEVVASTGVKPEKLCSVALGKETVLMYSCRHY